MLNYANRIFILRLLTVIIFLLPLFWMVGAALHPQGVPLPRSLHLLPERITLENFGRVWRLVPIGRFLLNSLLINVIAVPITLVIASWTGFSMAQLPQGSQRFWVIVCLAILMIPGIALWSTRFLVFKWLGWLNTPLALIAPVWMGTSPFYVLMFYRSFRRIPTAVYDAARLDGADVWQSWALVALPMVRPTAVGVALLAFAFYWGDFISPLLYLRSESLYTLPIALQLLQQLSRSDWPLLMAAATFATMVPIALFLLLQPYFSRVSE
jgi:multiple sugar transport system permease protein